MGALKCRRAGCGHPQREHSDTGCHAATGFCLCDAFLSREDVTAAPKPPGTAETAYRAAYERGVRRAAPEATFALAGRVGSVLGPALRAHAIDSDDFPLTGDALLAWIEAEAFAFRAATAGSPQFWGGWSVWHFARWLNERAAKHVAPTKSSRLQGGSGRKF